MYSEELIVIGIIVLLVFVGLIYIMREIVCWYLKTSDILETLKSIDSHLQALVSNNDTITPASADQTNAGSKPVDTVN